MSRIIVKTVDKLDLHYPKPMKDLGFVEDGPSEEILRLAGLPLISTFD